MSSAVQVETDNPGAKPRTAGSRTTIHFEHKLFDMNQDIHFRKSDTASREPVLVMNLSDSAIALPFRSIKREFKIADETEDGSMLEMVAAALDYVSVVRPGDPIPPEILTGEPSWEIGEYHRAYARQRLVVQLTSWHAGDENTIAEPALLRRVARETEAEQNLDAACEHAAEHLGYGKAGKDQVMAALQDLTGELAAIEVLREKFCRVTALRDRFHAFRRLYSSNMSVFETVDRVARLVVVAENDLEERIAQIDAETSEIIPLLLDVEVKIPVLRNGRDDLFRRLAAWDELHALWFELRIAREAASPSLWLETYRFLAQRFMPAQEWALASSLHRKGKEMKTEMVW